MYSIDSTGHVVVDELWDLYDLQACSASHSERDAQRSAAGV